MKPDHKPMEAFIADCLKEAAKHSPFQQRVIKEREDLVKKLDSLIAFIETETFKDLEPEERYLLILQRDNMQGYACVLADRIFAFKAV